MRDPADALKDPRPGDVIQIRPGWTRTVISNDGEYVVFKATYNGYKERAPYSVRTVRWGPSLDDLASVEVLHVAP